MVSLCFYNSNSYRFPEVFVHQEEVRIMQSFIEKVIGAAVASNLKQSHIPKDAKTITQVET